VGSHPRTCSLALAPMADAKVERSREITAPFQREHPCPSTGKRWGACPGWVKDHRQPALQRRAECRLKHAMANDRGCSGKESVGTRHLPGQAMICLDCHGPRMPSFAAADRD
jgi:hypothetical protein